ncbi:hypothetical protein HETIRDRAFT_322777 [Heterobasidion irregulare TC 32-1]|uniref:C2H2-type domain-containing protein n=1 Tax=Heterobasidion irregulare (strain TC 32-1) TaxID=747525 RepID=W4K323_HETIT|nr:uncharacterized protein HETIRDRAFT_322777 [Heterobasidion irregulare TC 32-1]ETW79461.1 hypothetical protein HETIRDRAFT_322777 [Heterobasidion irregulare TC 32-1]
MLRFCPPFASTTLTNLHSQYPTIEPEWVPVQPLPMYAMAGPSHVVSGDVHCPQQMLPAGGSYYQAALPMAYRPMYAHEEPAIPHYSHYAVQPQYGALAMSELPVAGPSAPQAGTSGDVVARLATSKRRLRLIPHQPAGTSEGFEGDTLNHTKLTLRKSVHRKAPANKNIPKAVKAMAKGKSRTKAPAPAPRTGGKKTPYLTAKHKCIDCTTGFKRKAELTRHMQWGKAHIERSLRCDQCDKKFSRPDSLRNHKRNVHD